MVADERDWQAFAEKLLDLASMDGGKPDVARIAKAGAAMSAFKARRIETMVEAVRTLRLLGFRGRAAGGPDGVLAFRDRLLADPGLSSRMQEELSRPAPSDPSGTTVRIPQGPPASPVAAVDETGWHKYASNLLRVAGLETTMPPDEELAAAAAVGSPYPPGRIVVMLRAARLVDGLGLLGSVTATPDAVLAFGRRLDGDPTLAATAAEALGEIARPAFHRKERVRAPKAKWIPSAPDPVPSPFAAPPAPGSASPVVRAAGPSPADLSDAASRVSSAVAARVPVNHPSGVHPARLGDPAAWVAAYARALREGRLDAWRAANLASGRRRRVPAAAMPAPVGPPHASRVSVSPASSGVPDPMAAPAGTVDGAQVPAGRDDVGDKDAAKGYEGLADAVATLGALVDGRDADPAPAAATYLRLAANEPLASPWRAAFAFGAVACKALSGDRAGAALLASDWALPDGLGPLRTVALAACCPGLRGACADALVGHPGWMALVGMAKRDMAYYDAAYLLRPLYAVADDVGRGILAIALAALAPGGPGD